VALQNRNVAADGRATFIAYLLSAPIVNLAAVPLTGVVVPTRLSNVGLWIDFPDGGQASIGSTCMADGLALARLCSGSRIFRSWSYRIPGPPFLVDYVVFFAAAISAGRRDAVEAPAEENHALGDCVWHFMGVRL